MSDAPQIRIFFSSPGDVTMERQTARRVCDRVQTEIGDRAKVAPYFWEHEVMLATKDYQQNIPELEGFDIVVCILWSRLGTPLDPERHPKPGGGFFQSGTEYEFFTAMQAHQLNGTPDIFVFHNQTEPRRPSRPKDVREAFDREIDRLDEFFEMYFQDEKYFTRAINLYSTLGEFEDKLTLALQSYISGRLPKVEAGETRVNQASITRSPYLGLASFDFIDSDIFFGRTAETGQIIAALQAQETQALASADEASKRFLLILGSSGSGKSSLARAGVLPLLVQPGVIEGAQSWRHAILKAGDHGGDPVLALTHALVADHALPELIADGITTAELADMIRQHYQGAGLMLRQALSQAGSHALVSEQQRLRDKLEHLSSQHREEDVQQIEQRIAGLEAPTVRIALLIDQLEELFTADVPAETIAVFLDVISALAMSGRVFVVGTLRSDFYPQCLEWQRLVELMSDGGTYHLPAPDAASIGQMIRRPANAAGLQFERNNATGESLDEMLRDAALTDPEALPLLSYTLQQLYDTRSSTGVLTIAAYQQLGGLEGAIGSRAEAVFTSLDRPIQEAFDGVCRQLITLCDDGEPTRRRAKYVALSSDANAKALIDALTEARLLTADSSSDREPTVAVAHEALLRCWPRITAWVQSNRTFLRVRTRIVNRLHDYNESNQSPDFLIPRGSQLAEAEEVLTSHTEAFTPEEISYISSSSDAARQREQKRLRRARFIAIGATALSLVAIGAGVIATNKTAEAEKQTGIAREKEQEAKSAAVATKEAIIDSEFQLGALRLASGERRSGISSLVTALTLDSDHPPALARLYTELLRGGIPADPILAYTWGGSELRQRISGSVDGAVNVFATIGNDGLPLLVDIAGYQTIEGPWQREPNCLAPAIYNDGEHLANIRNDKTTIVWNTETREEVGRFTIPTSFVDLTFMEEARHYLVADTDRSVTLHAVADGEKVDSWTHDELPFYVQYWADSHAMSLSADSFAVYGLEEGKIIGRTPSPIEHTFYQISVARDLPLAAVSSFDNSGGKFAGTFTFIDVLKGEPANGRSPIQVESRYRSHALAKDGSSLFVAMSEGGPDIHILGDEPRVINLPHIGEVVHAAYSRDSQWLALSELDGTVHIIDATTGNAVFSPIHHDTGLESVAFTGDRSHLLTCTKETAYVWHLDRSQALVYPVDLGGETIERLEADGDTLTLVRDYSLAQLQPLTSTALGEAIRPDDKFDVLVAPDSTICAVYETNVGISFHRLDADEWSETARFDFTEDVKNWSWSRKSDALLITTETAELLIDSTSGELIRPIETEHNFAIIESKDSPAIFHIPHELIDGAQRLVIEQEGSTLAEIEKGFRPNFAIFSSDSTSVAIVGTSESSAIESPLLAFELAAPRTTVRRRNLSGQIRLVEFSPDGTHIAIARDNFVQVIRANDLQDAAAPITMISTNLERLVWSPDGRFVAVAELDGSDFAINVFDWQSGLSVSPEIVIARQNLIQMAFTHDGAVLNAVTRLKTDEESSNYTLRSFELLPASTDVAAVIGAAQVVAAKRITGADRLYDSPHRLRSEMPAAAFTTWWSQTTDQRTVSPRSTVSTSDYIDKGHTINRLLSELPASSLAYATSAYSLASSLRGVIQSSDSALAGDEILRRTEDIGRFTQFATRNRNGKASTLLTLAKTARELENDSLEKSYLEELLALDSESVPALARLARMAENEHDYEAALPLRATLARISPDSPLSQYNHAIVLDRLSRLEDAQKIFDGIDDYEAMTGDARFLLPLHRGDKKAAIDGLLASADGHDERGSIMGQALRAIAANLRGDQEAVLLHYRRVLEEYPQAKDIAWLRASKFPRLLLVEFEAVLDVIKESAEEQ